MYEGDDCLGWALGTIESVVGQGKFIVVFEHNGSKSDTLYTVDLRLPEGAPVLAEQEKKSGKLEQGIVLKAAGDSIPVAFLNNGEIRTFETVESIKRDPNPPAMKKFNIGDTIKANWKQKGRFYAGKIANVCDNDRYDIHYNDGDKEKKVHAYLILATTPPAGAKSESVDPAKIAALVKGAQVLAEPEENSGYFHQAVVLACNGATTKIAYLNMQIRECKTSQLEIDANPPAIKTLKLGEEVKVNWKCTGKFYYGKIAKDCGNNCYDINYNDGDKESNVHSYLIWRTKQALEALPKPPSQADKLFEGAQVYAFPEEYVQYKNQAVVLKCMGDKTRVAFLNGTSRVLAADTIEIDSKPPAIRTFKVGDAIRANYNFGGKMYPGKIAKVCGNDKYDIAYDDGDKDSNMHAYLILSGRIDPTKPKHTPHSRVTKAELARIKGKIELVNFSPDYKVEIVDRYADLHVVKMDSYARNVGEWEITDFGADFKVEIVQNHGDFKVKWVDRYPGVQQ